MARALVPPSHKQPWWFALITPPFTPTEKCTIGVKETSVPRTPAVPPFRVPSKPRAEPKVSSHPASKHPIFFLFSFYPTTDDPTQAEHKLFPPPTLPFPPLALFFNPILPLSPGARSSASSRSAAPPSRPHARPKVSSHPACTPLSQRDPFSSVARNPR
jgi:hypothetical protein